MPTINIFAFSSILVFIFPLLLAIFLFWKGKQNFANILFGIVCFFVSLWGFCAYKFSTTTSKEIAFFWWQIGYLAPILNPVIYYHFVISFLRLREKSHKIILFLAYFLGIVFVMFDLFFEKTFLGDLRWIFNQFWWHDWIKHKSVIWMIFYILFWWILLIYSFSLLLKSYKEAEGIRRNQLRYLILGSAIGWLGGALTYLRDFRIDIYPYCSGLFLGIYPLIIAYAIVKHRLMDIHVAITRIGIFSILYVLLLFIPFYIGYQTKSWILSAICAFIFASVGPFIFNKLQKKATDLILMRQRRYQKTLLRMAEGMTRIYDLERLLKLIALVIKREVKVRYIAVFCYDREKRTFPLKYIYGHKLLQKTPPAIKEDEEFIDYLIKQKEPFLYEEADEKIRKYLQSILETNFSLLVPSLIHNNLMGFLVLGEKLDKSAYSPEDINTFKTLSLQWALALENIHHLREAQEKARMEQELITAHQIQQSLLPPKGIKIEDFNIEGIMQPAREVGGDYYDFILYHPHKIGIVVADVSGKGLDSGMVMSMTKSAIYTLSEQNLSPQQLVIQLNKVLYEQLHQQKFISLIYAEYLPQDNTLRWAGAGQEHIIIYSPQGIKTLKTGGIVLGMLEDVSPYITQNQIKLQPQQKIIFYTDGVIEAKNPQGKMLSLQGFLNLIQQIPLNLDSLSFLQHLKQKIQQFTQNAPQYDDWTVVVMGRG